MLSSSSAKVKRAYLSDQKKPLEHLKPKSLVISTVRVVFVQGGTTVTSVLGEQLTMEIDREELVKQGKLTPEQAEKDAQEWEKV